MKFRTWRRDLLLILKQSVITGVPELIATRSKYKKLLRLCVFAFCLTGFFYYTGMFMRSYWRYPTVMDVVVSHPDDVEVPAVTICSHNGISASLFCDLYPNLCSPARNYSEFCERFFYFCNGNYEYPSNITMPAIIAYELPKLSRDHYRLLGNQPEDLIEYCQVVFPTYSRPCINGTKWISVFDTMGLPNNCYTLNSYIGNVRKKIYTIPAKAFVNLKIKTAVKDSFYTATPSVMQMTVHNPRLLVNPFKKGFAIKPCYNYFVYPSKTVNVLMEAPYATNCTDYVKMWYARGGYGPLTRTQCREECLLNISIIDSNCTDPFYISYPNTAPICDHPAYSNRYFSKCANVCSRACHREDILTDIEEHASLLARNNKDDAEECSSIVTLAFSRMEVKTFTYTPKYQGTEVFSYIGGLLGVWLGISLLAISDVVETFFVIFQHFRKRLKKKATMKELARPGNIYYDCFHCDSKGNFRLKIY